jgi:hypothetical protein
MRRLLTAFVVPILGLFLLIGCKEVKPTSVPEEECVDSVMEEEVIADSTIYGVCGDGTAMHTLELITDGGDTLSYAMMVEEDADVQGGLLVGDRMAVIGKNTADGLVATKIINLTTLMGKWTSLDKNFELQEGGVVQSNIKTESNPWVAWKILNGQLLLNTDTFDITSLGADSLYIENKNGIFVYKRQK